MIDRAWWTFRLPNSICHVPAGTEEQARDVLRRNCYDGAPVDSWPCLGSRWTSRERIANGKTHGQRLEDGRK